MNEGVLIANAVFNADGNLIIEIEDKDLNIRLSPSIQDELIKLIQDRKKVDIKKPKLLERLEDGDWHLKKDVFREIPGRHKDKNKALSELIEQAKIELEKVKTGRRQKEKIRLVSC